MLGQAQLGALRAYRRRRGRGLAHRVECAPEDHDVEQQQREQDRKGDPRHLGKERGDHVVDDDVAVGEVLADLDPVGAAADRSGNADAEQHGTAMAVTQEPVVR